MIDRHYERLATTLSTIRGEVARLRAIVEALELPPEESARLFTALSLIEKRANSLFVSSVRERGGH